MTIRSPFEKSLKNYIFTIICTHVTIDLLLIKKHLYFILGIGNLLAINTLIEK